MWNLWKCRMTAEIAHILPGLEMGSRCCKLSCMMRRDTAHRSRPCWHLTNKRPNGPVWVQQIYVMGLKRNNHTNISVALGFVWHWCWYPLLLSCVQRRMARMQKALRTFNNRCIILQARLVRVVPVAICGCDSLCWTLRRKKEESSISMCENIDESWSEFDTRVIRSCNWDWTRASTNTVVVCHNDALPLFVHLVSCIYKMT